MEKILVWDWPVRLGHWLMASAFALAWLSRDAGSRLHLLAGGTLVAVASFRVIWGVVGSRHARFSAFLRGPAALFGYLISLLRLQPEHHAGHNPAGGWATTLLLALALATGAAGWAQHAQPGGHWLENWHAGLAVAMLVVVFAHLAGLLAGSLGYGENLIGAMLNGRKNGLPDEAIASARPGAALMLLAWVAIADCWLLNC